MTSSSVATNLLPQISLRRLYQYLGRYARFHPASTRSIPPAQRIRAPTERGVGIFFFPADRWTKTSAMSVGPLGETTETIHPSKIQICRPIAAADSTNASAQILYWGVGGTVRIVKNLTSGVAEGFAVNLELHGVGYRAEADEENNKLILRVGFSHTVDLPLNDGKVFFNVINPQLVQVAGINRAQVHQMAAKVRSFRPPEPYKGKGIRYQSEPVRRKETKKD